MNAIEWRDGRAADWQALSALALRSKAAWGYDAEFMAACALELTYSPAQLADWIVVCAQAGAEPIGFAAGDPRSGTIEALFVEPDWMGRRIGGTLLGALEQRMRQAGCRSLEVASDPNARVFYERSGYRRHGAERSPSTGRLLPLLSKRLAPMAPVRQRRGSLRRSD